MVGELDAVRQRLDRLIYRLLFGIGYLLAATGLLVFLADVSGLYPATAKAQLALWGKISFTPGEFTVLDLALSGFLLLAGYIIRVLVNKPGGGDPDIPSYNWGSWD